MKYQIRIVRAGTSHVVYQSAAHDVKAKPSDNDIVEWFVSIISGVDGIRKSLMADTEAQKDTK